MSLAEGHLRQLFMNKGRKYAYSKGEVILGTDEPPRGTYLIESGFVKVYSLTKQGNKYLHIIYGPGELFPLIWSINHLRPNVYYEALESTIVKVLPNDILEPYLKQIPEAYDFLHAAIEQFNIYTNRVDNLEYKFARERIIYRLLFLAGRFGVTTDQGVCLPPTFTQQLIGDSINVSRESVSRELERLERRSLIGFHGRQIIITDIEKLSSELDQVAGADFWHHA